MANASKDQVMAYLCGLVNECGPSPTIAQAAAYARSYQSVVTPADAIMALGVQDWDGVMKAYGRYIATGGKPALDNTGSANNTDNAEGGKKSEPSPPVRVGKRRHKPYDDEEILAVLKQMYVALDGQCTQAKVNAYAKEHHTPTYPAFAKRFGPSKNWAAIVDGIEHAEPTEHDGPAKQSEPIKQEPTMVVKPAEQHPAQDGTKTEVVKEPPTSTEETSFKVTIGLKISVPGLLEPISMEITIK